MCSVRTQHHCARFQVRCAAAYQGELQAVNEQEAYVNEGEVSEGCRSKAAGEQHPRYEVSGGNERLIG